MNKINITANNIILIGMPGAGKSTLGKKLAKTLGWSFIDSDDTIINYTKEPLETTLERDGIESFLDTERDAVLSLKCNKTVIATGGSVILRQESMKYLQSIGTVVYLRLPFCSLNQRVKNFETRGIAHKEGETLWDIYHQRVPLYEKYCNIEINCNKKTVNRIVNMIISGLNKG